MRFYAAVRGHDQLLCDLRLLSHHAHASLHHDASRCYQDHGWLYRLKTIQIRGQNRKTSALKPQLPVAEPGKSAAIQKTRSIGDS